MMHGELSVTESEPASEQLIEDLRIQAFRVYESIRAAQRECGADSRERLRKLSIAGSLAAGLAEQVMLVSPGLDIVSEEESAVAVPW
jgi:hypothetical protein